MRMRTGTGLLILATGLAVSGCGEVVYRSDALIIERHQSLSLTTCALHRKPLEERVVGESGGFQYQPPTYDESVQNKFPNSRRSVGGSCLIPHQIRMYVVKSCPVCERAEDFFWAEQQKSFEKTSAPVDPAAPTVTPPAAAPGP
jgi:hypothetical protein